MLVKITINEKEFQLDLTSATSLAIVLDFHGEQPNHFGSPKASSNPLIIGNFTGDTQQGSSCNCEIISLVPHCVGTHTESIGHVLHHKTPLIDCLENTFKAATLITLSATPSTATTENYTPDLQPTDQVITMESLQHHLGDMGKYATNEFLQALIIRTLPNKKEKQFRQYKTDGLAVFFTSEAMQFLHSLGVEHLLVDFPSVDRMYDDGLLSNHRTFWNIEKGSKTLKKSYHQHKTITEMIYVDNTIVDGQYLLDIQHPRWKTDAIPSNPILYKLSEINRSNVNQD